MMQSANFDKNLLDIITIVYTFPMERKMKWHFNFDTRELDYNQLAEILFCASISFNLICYFGFYQGRVLDENLFYN